MTTLSKQQLNRLRLVLARNPVVRRAIFVADAAKPTLALEYDERPASVDEARSTIQGLVGAIAPALGDTTLEVGLSAGGPDEIAQMAAGGTVVYERR